MLNYEYFTSMSFFQNHVASVNIHVACRVGPISQHVLTTQRNREHDRCG